MEGTTDAANQSYYAAEGLKALGYDARCARYTSCEYFLEGDFEFGFDRAKKGTAILFMPCGWPRSPIVQSGNTMSSIFIVGDRFCQRTWIWACSTKRGRAISSSITGARSARGVIGGRIPTATAFLSISKNDAAVRRAEAQLAHARGAIVHDAEMGLYVPRVAPLYYVPLRIDADRFSPNFPDGDAFRRPLVVHAPSSRSVKGSDVIESVLDELSASYDFDVRIIHDVPQIEAFEIYRQADIVNTSSI